MAGGGEEDTAKRSLIPADGLTTEEIIELFAGPEWGMSFEQIGWLTDAQIALLLRHRSAEGKLDYDLMRAEARAKRKERKMDRFTAHRDMRRIQGWPEHLIERELAAMGKKNG